MGTRGRSLNGFQGLLPGSVSKYCLQNSPVPVVVVRPSAKREKKKLKRRADPSRRAYHDILAQSGASGSQMLDKSERSKVVGLSGGEPNREEAAAVAKAIGLPGVFTTALKPSGEGDDGDPLSRVASGKSDNTSWPESPSPTGALIPDDSASAEWRSPDPDGLDSPALSDDEEGDEGNEGEEEDEEDEEEDDEEGGQTVRKGAPVDAARKMEAGEGKYLKLGRSRLDDV